MRLPRTVQTQPVDALDRLSPIGYDRGVEYTAIRRQTVVVLLCGGDKARQRRDIQRAQRMARALEGELA